MVAAAVLWSTLAITFFPRQPVPGGDFMQFYTMGAAARAGQWALQYDWPALHARQAELVPGSAGFSYKPAYPPLVAGLYAPWSALPFRTAYAAWAAAASVVYMLLIAWAATRCERLRPSAAVPLLLLFPPFVALILAGQTTLIPLTGFIAGGLALAGGSPVLAGVAFSLVALKPNFGLALAAVLLLERAWPIVGGIVIGLAVLAGASVAVAGAGATTSYLSTAVEVARNPALVEPDDTRHTHALRMTLEAVTPRRVATAGWLLVSAAAVGLTLRIWRRSTDWPIRLSALLLATLIVSPHVLSYDAVLLAPACLWIADRGLAERRWDLLGAVLLLAVLYVTPHARLTGVPISVIVGFAVLWRLHRLPVAAPVPGAERVP